MNSPSNLTPMTATAADKKLIPIKMGDRVILRQKKDAWYAGTIRSIGKGKVLVELDATGKLQLVHASPDAGYPVLPISDVTRITEVLTDAQASGFFAPSTELPSKEEQPFSHPVAEPSGARTLMPNKVVVNPGMLEQAPPDVAKKPKVPEAPPPDFRKALRLMAEFVSSNPESRVAGARQTAELSAELLACGLGVKMPASVPLYKVVDLQTGALGKAVASKTVSVPNSAFTSWFSKPSVAASKLSRWTYGIVTTWYPPSSAVVADFGAVLKHMRGHKGAMTRLGGPLARSRFALLDAALGQSNIVIVRGAPVEGPCVGLVTSSKTFAKSLVRLGLSHSVLVDPTSSSPLVYTRFFDIRDSHEDLGL